MIRREWIGERFGRLTVTALHGPKHCLCVCDCGATKVVIRQQLARARTRSCGCLRAETTSARSAKHRKTRTPEYLAYQNAKNRCDRPADPRFESYGGRRIEMRFANFEEFWDALGPRPSSDHSLDRIDPNGHYEAGNVRWATRSEQARNKENSRLVEIEGVTRPLADWCEHFGHPYKRIWERIRKGADPVAALKTPSRIKPNLHTLLS